MTNPILGRKEIIDELRHIADMYDRQRELVHVIDEKISEEYIAVTESLFSSVPQYPYNAKSIEQMEDFYNQCKVFDSKYNSIFDGSLKDKILSSSDKQVQEYRDLDEKLSKVTCIDKEFFYIARKVALKMQSDEDCGIMDAVGEVLDEEREKAEKRKR